MKPRTLIQSRSCVASSARSIGGVRGVSRCPRLGILDSQRRSRLAFNAAPSDEPSTSGSAPSSTQAETPTPKPESARIQRTMADLDALLGLQEDTSKASPSKASGAAVNGASTSADTINNAEPESQRLTTLTNDPKKADLENQFGRIIERARKLADQENKDGGYTEAEQQALRKEFDTLLQNISTQTTMDKDDIKKLKEAAFGPQTYFVTETVPLTTPNRTGLLVRGNLRDERTKVFELVQAKTAELFGDKYAVIMVEDEQSQQDGFAMPAPPGLTGAGPRSSGAAARAQELNTPRVAFQIIPAAQALPPQTNGWKQAAAFVLIILFVVSVGQLALAANITKLPKETLDWFSNPANFESNELPPGLENWDPISYFSTAAPIFSAVLGVNVTHEIGHRIAAFLRQVKLGPTYFVPNFQIGSFGAITPFTSLIKNRFTLWDIAAAGPLAGVLFSSALLAIGLAQSQPGSLPADALVPVPTQLFQGSLLLGSITRLALGETALRASEVPVSPLVIAGWCGLITQALQLLPVGCLDGGRMVQAAYGQGTLALTSLFTYIGLGLGLLGSSLALPYGLYVIICQRTAEQYISDNVTPAGDSRATATAVALLTAILVLVPMAPELADAFGVGPGRDALFF